MLANAHLSTDDMRPAGEIQLGASVTTRLRLRMRGVERTACALESIRAYRSADAFVVERNSTDSQQYQQVERTGADIVKRGRRP